MKRFMMLVLLGMFSFAVVGCEASGRVGDDDRRGDRDGAKLEVEVDD